LALSIGGRQNNNNNNNDKRDLILRGSNFYKQQEFNTIDTTTATIDETIAETGIIFQELPPPDNSAIEKALRTVANK
jgi:hypothetical protein